eukprot:scaffold13773_cov68-Phaeocystis_antarctica.AAC.3
MVKTIVHPESRVSPCPDRVHDRLCPMALLVFIDFFTEVLALVRSASGRLRGISQDGRQGSRPGNHLSPQSPEGRTWPATLRVAGETEAQEAEDKRCRLCFGDDDGPLVQPCACRGSAKWIHKHCLEQWRRTSPRKDAAYRCGQCMDEYRDALSLELLSARLQAERTDGDDTVFTLGTLALELKAQGKFDEAEPLYHEALEVLRETLGNRHPCTLGSINNLGSLLYSKGDLAAAELLSARR